MANSDHNIQNIQDSQDSTRESDVNNLSLYFPDTPRDVLVQVLQQNHGQLHAAIDHLLALDFDEASLAENSNDTLLLQAHKADLRESSSLPQQLALLLDVDVDEIQKTYNDLSKLAYTSYEKALYLVFSRPLRLEVSETDKMTLNELLQQSPITPQEVQIVVDRVGSKDTALDLLILLAELRKGQEVRMTKSHLTNMTRKLDLVRQRKQQVVITEREVDIVDTSNRFEALMKGEARLSRPITRHVHDRSRSLSTSAKQIREMQKSASNPGSPILPQKAMKADADWNLSRPKGNKTPLLTALSSHIPALQSQRDLPYLEKDRLERLERLKVITANANANLQGIPVQYVGGVKAVHRDQINEAQAVYASVTVKEAFEASKVVGSSASVDLHGLTRVEALEVVRQALLRRQGIKLQPLRIVTGRGNHTGGESVLFPVICKYLESVGCTFTKDASGGSILVKQV